MWQTLGLGGVVLGVTLALRRDLLLICFDPGQARVMALPDRFLNYLLLGLLSLAIVVSLQAVGIILVVAMLVTPGSIAHLWTDRFDRMLLIAVVAAVAPPWRGFSSATTSRAPPAAASCWCRRWCLSSRCCSRPNTESSVDAGARLDSTLNVRRTGRRSDSEQGGSSR